MRRMYPAMKRLEIIENAPEILSEPPAPGRLRRMTGIEDDRLIALYQGVLCLKGAWRNSWPPRGCAVAGMSCSL